MKYPNLPLLPLLSIFTLSPKLILPFLNHQRPIHTFFCTRSAQHFQQFCYIILAVTSDYPLLCDIHMYHSKGSTID